MPERPRARRRLIMLAAGMVALAAGTTGAALLLRDSGPAPEGSPVPAVTTMSSDEAYLRQVCGEDFDPARGEGMCVVRRSLSPSEIAEVLDTLPTGPE